MKLHCCRGRVIDVQLATIITRREGSGGRGLNIIWRGLPLNFRKQVFENLVYFPNTNAEPMTGSLQLCCLRVGVFMTMDDLKASSRGTPHSKLFLALDPSNRSSVSDY